MNKLTEQEIAKVFCLYGIGAPVSTLDGDGEILVIYPRVVEVHLNVIGYQQEMKGRKGGAEMHYKYSFEKQEVQLLLKPLDKITDEHAIEVAKMTGVENPTIVLRHGDRVLVCTAVESDNEYPIGEFCSITDKSIYYDDNVDWNGTTKINRFVDNYLTDEGYAVPLWFGIGHWANGKTAIDLSLAAEQNNLKLNV